MSVSEAHLLLERLIADAEFRARFEVDPAGTARAAGFSRFADDLAAADPAPIQALDVRESRSSLAGAFIAAAAEGFALVEVGGRLFGVDDAQAAVGGKGQTWNADSYGAAGSGGPITPEAEALLHNDNVSFETAGTEDLQAGRMDPRVVAVITEISKEHRIVVSCTCSDHAMHTAGGSVSNHYYGRAFDIGSVDGKPVNSANGAARELALELAKLDPSIRPSEIGSPWALSGAAYFTDGGHQDHLHVGYDDPIQPDWKPPVEESSPDQSDPPLTVKQDSPQPAEDDDDTAGDDLRADGTVDTSGDDDEEDDSDDQDSAEAASAAAGQLSPDPDDWEGNLDDEDGGADEVDGSNEDEPDEAGGEDDDSDTATAQPDAAAGSEDAEDSEDSEDSEEDDDEGDDEGDDEDEDEEDEDENEGADEPGEGSNGEDATDDNAGGDSSDSGSGDSSDSSEGSGSDDSSSNDPDTPSSDPGADLEAPDDYPGDDAPREEVAAWMAVKAEERGLPPELPVMASLVESGLRNLNYGDADSVGFFQMRTSIWDQGTYAGYQDRAELQLKWFLDRAEAVKEDRVGAGRPIDDPGSYGEWIADVERPAEQYRGRYQLRLDEARALLDAANPETDTPVASAGNEAQVLKAVDPDAADSASR